MEIIPCSVSSDDATDIPVRGLAILLVFYLASRYLCVTTLNVRTWVLDEL